MDRAVEVFDAPPGAEGVSVAIRMSGETVQFILPFRLLAEVIRKVRLHEAGRAPSDTRQPDHPNAVQTLVAAGLAQPVGSAECALAVETVESGTTVFHADRLALVSLREQIDKALALQGGHGTIQ